MTNLVIGSLEIENFRAFRHLKLEKSAQINLIVGKNNVGKTCLLEALQLYAERGNPELIHSLLAVRNEIYTSSVSNSNGQEVLRDIKHLFYGRKMMENEGILINTKYNRELFIVKTNQKRLDRHHGWNIFINDGAILWVLDKQPVKQDVWEANKIGYIFITAKGFDNIKVGQLWDNVALTDAEDHVLQALSLIAPQVERLNLIGTPRIPLVKIKNQADPVPLASLGEGMTRMFGIALALVNAKNGLLLIDEIESGFHYSVQADMWRLIFEIAHQLRVQVFATSHSWDCIQAFQQATKESEAKGLLISLRHKRNETQDVTAVLFDEEELSIATQEQIEVR